MAAFEEQVRFKVSFIDEKAVMEGRLASHRKFCATCSPMKSILFATDNLVNEFEACLVFDCLTLAMLACR